MSRIPFELSDYIIDFLHGDAKALKACASVCRAWAPAARLHLFRNVVLKDRKYTLAFERLLRTTPDLGWYVRELTVSKLIEACKIDSVSAPLMGSTTFEKTLPYIFAHIPAMHTLSLSHIDMKCIPDFTGLQHPSVTKLTLAYCQFAQFADIVDLVGCFPKLTELALSGLTWKEETRACAPTYFPTLRSLSLGRDMDCSERLFDWFEAATFHTSITALSARCTSERDADLVGPFIALAGASLRTLDLDWAIPGDKIVILPDSMSLAQCTSLESLSLHYPVHYSTSVPWVTSLLSTLDAASVRTITCHIRLLGNIDALDWDGLCTIFSSEAYKSLEQVRFAINLWVGVHSTFEEVEGLVRARLSAFDKKGMLSVVKS